MYDSRSAETLHPFPGNLNQLAAKQSEKQIEP